MSELEKLSHLSLSSVDDKDAVVSQDEIVTGLMKLPKDLRDIIVSNNPYQTTVLCIIAFSASLGKT